MPLISKIPRRTRNVTEADFESVPRITDYTSSYNGISGLLEVWNDSVRYTPQDFVSLFDGLLEDNDEVHIGSLKPETLEFNIYASGDRMVSFVREYEFADPDTDPALTYTQTNIPKRLQGTGIGRKWSVAGIDMNVMLGVAKDQFEASMEMGVYAWGKSRCMLDNSTPIYEAINQNLAKLVMAKLRSVRGLLPDEQYYEAGIKLAETFQTADLHALTDMSFDLLEPIREARLAGEYYDVNYFRNALQRTLGPKPVGEKETFLNEQALSMADLLRSCSLKKLPLSVGKFVLANGRGRMMREYQDDAHITEVMERMGGFRNSVIMSAEQQRTFV